MMLLQSRSRQMILGMDVSQCGSSLVLPELLFALPECMWDIDQAQQFVDQILEHQSHICERCAGIGCADGHGHV